MYVNNPALIKQIKQAIEYVDGLQFNGNKQLFDFYVAYHQFSYWMGFMLKEGMIAVHLDSDVYVYELLAFVREHKAGRVTPRKVDTDQGVVFDWEHKYTREEFGAPYIKDESE